MARPVVRNEANNDWIDVFCKGGWKMKTAQGDYITLNANNTKFRNADNTAYVDFSCPIPPPTVITKGKVRSNRIVDSNGFLWATGHPVGKFDNDRTTSNTWRKCRDPFTKIPENDYIKNVKAISSSTEYDARTNGGGLFDARYPATTIFTYDNRILFSGLAATGLAGGGALPSATQEGNLGTRNQIKDVTDAWAQALGQNAKIIQHDPLGAIVLEDGTAFTLGYATYYYANDNTKRYVQRLGYSARPNNGSTDGVSQAEGRITRHATWGKITKLSGEERTQLANIKQVIRTKDHYTFMLTEDGRILQTVFWIQNNSLARSLLIYPTLPYDGMRELAIPFAHGKVVALHQGGVAETENGDLFVFAPPVRLNPSDTKDFFQGFEFVPLGVNLKSFGNNVKAVRIALDWKMSGASMNHSLFIQLDDGRLYASGDNASGWFGVASVSKTNLNAVTLINRNVYDFDIDFGGCILVKNDGSIWASGNNQFGRLGVGHNTLYVREWEQGILSND